MPPSSSPKRLRVASGGDVRRPFAQIEARERRRIRQERTAATWERAAALHRETALVLSAVGDDLGAAEARRNEERCGREAGRWRRLARVAG